MKKILVALLTAAMLMFATPANAAVPYLTYADEVAKDIGCQNYRRHYDHSSLFWDAGVCKLKGKRVNIITYTGKKQQAAWNRELTKHFGPNFWWAQSKGVSIVAKNGNRQAAVVGRKAIKGTIRHG